MVISEAQTGDTAKHNLDQIFDEETLAKLWADIQLGRRQKTRGSYIHFQFQLRASSAGSYQQLLLYANGCFLRSLWQMKTEWQAGLCLWKSSKPFLKFPGALMWERLQFVS